MQTFTPLEYLKIDIANNFGLDKLPWNDRIAWFDAQESQLDQLVSVAEEPALYYAGIKAYRNAKAGRPIGYMISLDATSSGIQLLAALTCDRKAAMLCNVIDTGYREDAYTNIYQHMLSIVQETAKISRDDTKNAIMTAFYTSKAVPRMVFGDGALLDVFYSCLQELAPAAWDLNEAMLGFWNPEATEHSWVLPDNFHARIKVMDQVRERVHFLNQPFDVFYHVNQPTKEGRSLGANTTHSVDGFIVREMTRRCDHNPKQLDRVRKIIAEGNFGKPDDSPDNTEMTIVLWNRYLKSGYLSARILDYLDENTMRLVDTKAIIALMDSFPKKPFKVISIHDCFRCHPNYGNDLRAQYNLQLQLIARSTMLQDIISQLLNKSVTIGKLDPSLPDAIGTANYALS